MTTKTQRLINRINEKESFYDVAYVCEDFDTFIDEIAEWQQPSYWEAIDAVNQRSVE